MEEVFGPDGLIAQYHPNYEYRPGQIEMAEQVHRTLQEGGVILVEAGTGTGKTLAYLIPSLVAGRRVLVATATKALQEQLYKKNIPFLQQIAPTPFKAVCMKGRSNYVCLHRLKKSTETPMLEGLEDVNNFERIRKWAAESETGDRAELTDLPETLGFWPQIDARAETCLGQRCPDFDVCFITRMRREALDADVVIINHHLFFADLALRNGEYGSVLPEYSTVIFDEAHEIEDVAAEYFGTSVSNYRIADLLQDALKIPIEDPGQPAEVTPALPRLGQPSAVSCLTLRVRGSADAGDEETRRPARSHRGSSSQGRFARETEEPNRYQVDERYFVREEPDGSSVTTKAGEAYFALSNAIVRLVSALGLVTDAPP